MHLPSCSFLWHGATCYRIAVLQRSQLGVVSPKYTRMDNILVINLVSESSYQVSAVNLVIAVSLTT